MHLDEANLSYSTSKDAAALIRNLLFADNTVVLNLYFFTMMKIARDERYRDFSLFKKFSYAPFQIN